MWTLKMYLFYHIFLYCTTVERPSGPNPLTQKADAEEERKAWLNDQTPTKLNFGKDDSFAEAQRRGDTSKKEQ